MIYNLNANRKSEGQAISEILATNSWPNVEIMVQSDLQFDGFLDSFISTYSSDQLAALNTTVFKQEDSIRDLLIQIENLISSRQVCYGNRLLSRKAFNLLTWQCEPPVRWIKDVNTPLVGCCHRFSFLVSIALHGCNLVCWGGGVSGRKDLSLILSLNFCYKRVKI